MLQVIPSKTVLVEEEPEPINTGNKELDEVLTTGTAYMSELNTLNMNIPNIQINKQVDEMMHFKGIFDFITKILLRANTPVYELLSAYNNKLA